MINVRARSVLASAVVLLAGACSATQSFKSSLPQTFEFGNDGTQIISDLKVSYSELVLPSGITQDTYEPSHMMAISETWDSTIPKIARATWVLGDEQLSAEVPIKSLIKGCARLYGWRFYVVDNQLDVYLLCQLLSPDSHYRVDRKKVYSVVGQ